MLEQQLHRYFYIILLTFSSPLNQLDALQAKQLSAVLRLLPLHLIEHRLTITLTNLLCPHHLI